MACAAGAAHLDQRDLYPEVASGVAGTVKTEGAKNPAKVQKMGSALSAEYMKHRSPADKIRVPPTQPNPVRPPYLSPLPSGPFVR